MNKQLHVRQSLQFDPQAPDNCRTDYTVTKVTNSVTPPIHDKLSGDDLEVYCQSDDWSVTIT